MKLVRFFGYDAQKFYNIIEFLEKKILGNFNIDKCED